jgi:UDP-glucose 4-epimerase
MGMSFRRACVTGGAGFIGSRLARQLLERNLEVVIVDNLSVGHRANVPTQAEFIEADILDVPRMEAAARSCDIVFHLAARVAIRSSFDFVVEDTTTNVAGTASVLRAAQRSRSVSKLIFASSMAVYSDPPSPEPIAETHLTRPLSPYGISKLAGEELTHSLCAAAGIASVVLRLFNTYGPGQLFSPYVGVVTIFVNKLSRSETPLIFGDGCQARDFVHVDDIISGFVRAMEVGDTGETFNIGTGKATTVNEIFRELAEHLHCTVQPEHVAAVAGELRYSVADISKARRLLRYEPEHDLESSLDVVVDEILHSIRAECESHHGYEK